MPKGKNLIALLVGVVILGLGFAGMQLLSGMRVEPPRKESVLRQVVVGAGAVEPGPVAAEIVAYGRLTSAEPVVVSSEVNGTLKSGDVPFRPGQRFRRGDLLIKVDTRQIKLDINAATSELLKALASVLPEIRVDFPEEYGVWQEYFNSCSFDRSLPDLPEAANNNIKLYLSRFNVYTIYFSIRDLEIMHEKHFLRAPFDGAITTADLRPGSNVRSGTRIGEIMSLEELEMVVPLTVEDMQWIELDQPVVLTSAEISGQWQARIRRIGTTIDQQTQTVQTHLMLDDSFERLYEGILLKAAIPGRTISPAVRIPRRALYRNRQVYMIEDGVLALRTVDVVRIEPDSVIIGGLERGDVVVTEVLQGVSPGMPARIKSADDYQRGAL